MNKLQKTLIGFSALALSHSVLADASLIKIGGGVRGVVSSQSTVSGNNETKLKSTTYSAIYAQIQHGLPYIPNYRFSSYSSSTKPKQGNSDLKIKHTSNELFWNFSFAIIEAQLGLASHTLTLNNNNPETMSGATANFIIDVPMLPITPSVNFDIGSGKNKVDSVGFDVAWSLAPGVYLNLGTKNYTYTSDKNNITIKDNTTYLGVSFNLGL